MSEPAPYPYASGDLLEQRNTYFYAPFGGAAFLDAWRRQRAGALRAMSALPAAATGAREPGPGGVDALLEDIHRSLTATRIPPGEPMPALNRLVQRFEVSKRLHGEYDANWRPTDAADYRYMERYIRFAEILDLAHERTGALPYLNALLKIVDTLASQREALSAAQRARLACVIEHEQGHVERLATRLGRLTHAA